MDNKYLPSKVFVARLLIIVILVTLFFVVKGVLILFKNKVKSGSSSQAKTLVVGDLIQKDSNNNGIPDWEEYLWGLDPTKNGPENKEYILSKKDSLVKSGEMKASDSSKPTDNDLLSQEFFATIISLQETGQLDETSMKSVAEALGKDINVTPLGDVYKSDSLTVVSDSTEANASYKKKITDLMTKYKDKDIGNELTFIIQGLANNNPEALYAARTVGDAYIAFGKELVKIPVPMSISAIELSAANNYVKVGESINTLTSGLADQIAAMKAIINYKNYSDALASDLEKIYNSLQ